MSVSLSANESMPGDSVTLRVRGDKGSCVCVATVDKSLYLLKPDFQLSPDKVGHRFTLIFHSLYSCPFSCGVQMMQFNEAALPFFLCAGL